MTTDLRDDPVVLAIGSNLGDRVAHLQAALSGMQKYMSVQAVSPVYETAPMHVTDQPAFLNAVFSGTTDLSPQDLLKKVKELETIIGRTPTFKYGPRVVDIDIIFYGDALVDQPNLIVPHALMSQREFVLRPLADILPTARHPVTKETVMEMLSKLPTENPTCLGNLLST